MNVLSLFDGISCGQIALLRAGIHIREYYASEINKKAISVTQHNFPNTIQLGCVTKVNTKELPKIDILLAGSPCKGFSIAGNGQNFKDSESKLFYEFIRILREVKPSMFLLENVRMKKEWRDIISDAVGVQPIMINSSSFSAQDRKRSYWTNIEVSNIPSECSQLISDILEKEVDDKYYIEPKRAIVICDLEVARRKIAYIGKDSQGNRIYWIHGKAITLVGSAGGLGAKTGLYAIPCITPNRTDKRQNGRRFKSPTSKFYTLTTQDRHGVLIDNHIRKLTPIECERLQTIEDDYTSILSDNQRYIVLGNGWTIDVISFILKQYRGNNE